MTDYLIRLPWPDAKLAPHAKGHWRPKAVATKAARSAAFWMARDAGIRDAMPDAELRFTYHPPDNRRRDASNLSAMLKAYIDGVADAMGCDDQGFRVYYPPRFDGVIKGGEIVCLITPSTVLLEQRGTIS